jgi:hypothetical protein
MSHIAEIHTRSFLGVSLRQVVLEAVLTLLEYQSSIGLTNDHPAYLHSYSCAKLPPVPDLEEALERASQLMILKDIVEPERKFEDHCLHHSGVVHEVEW